MVLSINPCQDFFEQHAQTPKKAEHLQKSGQALLWETLSASPHSPGIVQSVEDVIRLVVNPIHVNPDDGSITPTLMSDVKDKGGSVQRLAHIAREDAIAAGRSHAEARNATAAQGGQLRSIYGTVTLSVEDIRSVVVATQTRAFGVFDTAKEINPSHADIFQIVSGNGHEARSARLQLWQLASQGFQPA